MATIQGIYLALFGRPADPTGLAYFNGVTKNGADLSGIGNLAGQKEYTDRFTGKSTNEIINSIYQSLFGRDGETAGVAFWANKLATGSLTVNNIAIAILDGALGSDKTIVTAKIAAADLFTSHLDLPTEQQAYGASAANITLARDYITSVGSSHEGTGTEVDAIIARMLTSAGQAPGGDAGTVGGGVEPVNSAANFSGDDKLSITEDTVGAQTGGNLIVTDADAGQSTFQAVGADALKGAFGNFTFDHASGAWTYERTADLQSMIATDTAKTDTLTVTSADGSTHDIVVTIGGQDDQAAFSGDDKLSITEDTVGAQTGGNLIVTDADAGQSTFQAVGADALKGAFGNFTFDHASGAWTYERTADLQSMIATDTAKTDTLTVTSADGSTHDIVVTIGGQDDQAAFSGDDKLSITEDTVGAQTGGNLIVTDADAGQSTFQAVGADALKGAFGNFTFDHASGAWTYERTADLQSMIATDTAKTDTLTVTSADGSTHDIVVTIGGQDDQAAFSGDDKLSITEDTVGAQTGGNLIVTDADAGQSTFQAVGADALKGAFGNFTFDHASGAWTYERTADLQSMIATDTAKTDTLTVTSADGSTHDIVVTIGGQDDQAAFSGDDKLSITEDTVGAQTGGNLIVTDADAGQSTFQAVGADALKGAFGNFTFDHASGAWTYERTADLQSMIATDTAKTDTLTVTSADGSTHDIVVTIGGQDDQAAFSGDDKLSITEDTVGAQTGGNLIVTDADAGQSTFQAVGADALKGAFGNFTFDHASGAWTYERTADLQSMIATDTAKTDTLTVTSADGSTHDIVVTIGGQDDQAAFSGDDKLSITEDTVGAQTGGNLIVTDADAGQSTFQAVGADALKGAFGNFTFDHASGAWTYERTADLQSMIATDTAKTDTLTVTSADGSTHDIVVTIGGQDDQAAFSGDDKLSITEDTVGAQTGGNLIVTDADAGQSTFQAVGADALKGAFGNFTFDHASGAWTYERTADLQSMSATDAKTDKLTVMSADGSPHDIVVTINGVNDAATFGGIDTNSSLTEDSLTTTAVAGKLSVQDIDGPATFQAPSSLAGKYGTFTFSGGDWTYHLTSAGKGTLQSLKAGESQTDTLTVKSADNTPHDIVVTIKGVNDAPTVSTNIADQTMKAGAALNFAVPAGTFNDPDGDNLTYSFKVVNNGGNEISTPNWLKFDASSKTFSGTPTDAGTLNIKVIASDGSASISDTFKITVNNSHDTHNLTDGNVDNVYGFSVGGDTNQDYVKIPAGALSASPGSTIDYGSDLIEFAPNKVGSGHLDFSSYLFNSTVAATSVFELRTSLNTTADLSKDTASSAAELFKGFSSNATAISDIKVTTGWKGYIVAYDSDANGDNSAYIYHANAGTDNLLTAGEVKLVSVLHGVDDMLSSNFLV